MAAKNTVATLAIERSINPIRLWQWPNILALDAALIALFWQAVFANSSGLQVNLAAQGVLGLSVWLTYMADRLFDVTKRPLQQLHSARHRFAKQNVRVLWWLWTCVLLINIGSALTGLNARELQNGAALLILCLLYTAFNQILSRGFFPKELCVALIYAGGVIIFLIPIPGAELWAPTAALVLLCLINCLMIGAKEQRIDRALQVRSMAQLPLQLTVALYISCALLLCFLSQAWLLPIGLSWGAFLIIHIYRHHLSVESFRVLADSSLLIGPAVALYIRSQV